MVLFVEGGHAFTCEYGDIDEVFYDTVLEMAAEALEELTSLPETMQGPLLERLRRVRDTSSHIGWGYHDALVDFLESRD